MKKRSRQIIIPGSILILLSSLFLFFGPKYFTAQRIECYTQLGACPVQLSETIAWMKGRSLLSKLPTSQVRGQMRHFPEISSVNLYRRLPHTIVVSIFVRQPISLVSTSVLGAKIAVDKTGTAYTPFDSQDLPILLINELGTIPFALSPTQTKAVSVLSSIRPAISGQFTASLSGKTLVINTFSGYQILINVDKPPEMWLDSLQYILNGSKMMAKPPQIIDMRFNNPVLKY